MIKTRTIGTMRVRAIKHVITGTYKNGASYRTERPNGTDIDIRTGSKSVLNTSSGTDGAFRPCKHSKTLYRLQNNPGSLGVQYGYLTPAQVAAAGSTTTVVSTVEGGWVSALRTGITAFNNEVNADLELPPVQWSAWAQEALHDMLPTLAGGNTVLRSIIELKDFRHLGQSIVRRFNGRQAKLTEALLGVRNLPTDKTLQQLSRMFIQYKFAWRPFLQDVMALSQALDGFRRRWDEIIRRANTPQQSYWGRNLDGTEQSASTVSSGVPSVPGLAPGGWRGDAAYYVNRVGGKPARYSATLRYSYPIPSKMLESAGRILALRDYLGTDMQLSTVWEVIPFSFIVDWFVNLGRMLERLDVNNIQFKTEIRQFCHSVKYAKATNLTLRLNNGPGNVSIYGAPIPIVSAQRSVYERRVGIPDYRLAISTSGLSFNEFVLSVGLVGAI